MLYVHFPHDTCANDRISSPPPLSMNPAEMSRGCSQSFAMMVEIVHLCSSQKVSLFVGHFHLSTFEKAYKYGLDR